MKARVYWLFGLSGAGKSTLARAAAMQLVLYDHPFILLDGDHLRNGLCRDLGFSDEDRTENIRRVAETAKLCAEAGITVIAALITPKESMRQLAKEIIGADRFTPIFIDAGFEECQRRDVKGLYAKAAKGEIKDFTGLTSSFERPVGECLTVRTGAEGVAESVGRVVGFVWEKL